jgi:uncharacterized membrane protein
MTLLVLKLEVPDMMHHNSNEQMLEQLLALAPAFATYVVTFLIAGGFWFLHHLTFHFIGSVSVFLVWVNLVMLMLISLLPFSAGLMSHLLVHPVSQLFYFGNLIAIALLLNVHWHYAKYKGLAAAGSDSAEVLRITYRTATVAAAFIAAFVTAVFVPLYSAVSLVLVLAAGTILEYFKVSRAGARGTPTSSS